MIALVFCLVSIFTPGFSLQLFNSSLALSDLNSNQGYAVVCPPNPDPDAHSVFVPDPHDCTKYYECQGNWPILMECPHELYFDPVLNICNWPEEVDCTAKCSVQVVLADDDLEVLTTWSPEKHCNVENFQGFPPLTPENIYQCSNGLTFIKSQKDGITELSVYIDEKWEVVVMSPEIADINNYAVTAIPNLPFLILAGGDVEFLNNGDIEVVPTDGISYLDCRNFVNDGSAWTSLPSPYQLAIPIYNSCITASNEFLTVINGEEAPSVFNKDACFYPIAAPWDFDPYPKCAIDSVDFIDGVKDCISPKITQVYAIGTEKMYLINPRKGSVKLQRDTLPVTATSSRPVRLFYNPETSEVNVIGGTEDGIIRPACYTYSYAKHKWNKNRDQPYPCWAGRVLGEL